MTVCMHDRLVVARASRPWPLVGRIGRIVGALLAVPARLRRAMIGKRARQAVPLHTMTQRPGAGGHYSHPTMFAWRLASIIAIVVFSSAPVHAETDSARVDRLFMWASSGQVRFRDRVDPAKDSLGQMGEKAARWLVHKLDATDARERLTLADLFAKIGPAATPYLTMYLDSGGIYMPLNAARCLGQVKDTSSLAALVPKLDHSYYAVRSEVATTLGKIAVRSVVPALLARLRREQDGDVRKSCAVALGLMGDSSATTPLIGLLGDPVFGVRQTAQISLTQLKPPPLSALMTAAERLTGVARHGTLVALGGCDDSHGRRYLLGLLHSGDPLLRGFAIEGLAAHPTEDVRKRVRRLAKTESDPFVLAEMKRFEQQPIGK